MRLIRLALTLAAIATAGSGACGAAPESEVPSALIGVWVTRDRDYADRFLELRSDWVIFGTGGASISMLPVFEVETETGSSGEEIYSVGIEEEDGERGTLAIHFRGGSKPTLRLGNRSELWTRRPFGEASGTGEVQP